MIFLARTHKLRKEAAAQGKTFDDILAECDIEGRPFKFAERKTRKEQERKAGELPRVGTEDSERAERGFAAALSSGSETETRKPQPAQPSASEKAEG